MKKKTIFITLFVFITLLSFSQSCLPDGIHFGGQQQIDDFQQNYPGCTEIEGDVSIVGYMTDLSGISMLTAVYGDLHIEWLVELEDLSGLENLSEVGGDLYIVRSEQLVTLDGLSGLQSVGGKLQIDLNENLTTISSLSNLTSIGDELLIRSNPVLYSLEGINNVPLDELNRLQITDNPYLSMCSIENVCSFLSDPSGVVLIHDNDYGCNSPVQVADSCDIDMVCLPYGDYYFACQEDIDNFNTDYPDCNIIHGNMFIDGEDINSLEGLNNITRIEGDLYIGVNSYPECNVSLLELDGFENLEVIEGSFNLNYHCCPIKI